jgi:hypothetical protein
MLENLQEIIDRVKSGNYSPEDVRSIAAAIEDGILLISNGSGSVSVGRDASNSQIVTGDRNVIGDRNIVIYGADARTIRAALEGDREEQTAESHNFTSGQSRRLAGRRDALQQEWDLRSEKLRRLRAALAIEAGTAVKFQLEQQIQQEEGLLTKLENELARIEANLQVTPNFSTQTKMIPEPFTAIPVTAGILTNIATEIIKSNAQSLEGTLAGKVLKLVGVIEPNSSERLRDILIKALDLYFNRYPDRNLLGMDNFFLDSEVSGAIGSFLLNREPIDFAMMQQGFDRFVGSNEHSQQQIQSQGLTSERVVNDFIGCYQQVLREQLSLPLVVVLSEILNQDRAIVEEIRASEQRLREYIAGLQANQLSPQQLNTAYLQGQQQLAIAFRREIWDAEDPVERMHRGDAEALRIIQERLQPTPALFTIGLCKGSLLSPQPDRYFVSHGFTRDLLADWRQALVEGLAQSSYNSEIIEPYFSGDTLLGGFRLCGICERLYTSRFGIFLLPPSQDRNVYLELGIAIGLGAPFFLIQHYEAKIPAVLEGLSRYAKGGLFRSMRREIAGQIEEYDFGVVRFNSNLPQAASQTRYLVAGGESIEDEDFEGSIKDAVTARYPQLEMLSLTGSSAANSGWVLNSLVESIQSSRLAIYRVDEESSPSTFLALGISIGLDRPFLMVHRQGREVPQDLRGMGMYQFPNFVSLQNEIVPQHQQFFDRYAG